MKVAPETAPARLSRSAFLRVSSQDPLSHLYARRAMVRRASFTTALEGWSAFVRRLASFCGDKAAASAVEFALVSPLVILTILFLLSIGYMLIMNETLDYATQKAARQIRTGQVQSTSPALTQATFQTKVVCPLLTSWFNCSNVIINMQPVNGDYYPFVNAQQSGLTVPSLSNSQTSYCPGQSGQYVYVQILYPVSLFFSFLSSSTIATTYNGQKVYLIMSTATFLNEPFVAPASAC